MGVYDGRTASGASRKTDPAIRSYLRMMKLKCRDTEDSNHLELMIGELDRANSIVSEFIALARKPGVYGDGDGSQRRDHPPCPPLEADCLMRGYLLRRDHTAISVIELDQEEISQLLLSSARNSLDAMPNEAG